MKKKIRPRFGGFIFVISSVVECTGRKSMEIIWICQNNCLPMRVKIVIQRNKKDL